MRRAIAYILSFLCFIESTAFAQSAVDWELWFPYSQQDQRIVYEHEDTPETLHQSYVSAIGFTGGCIPRDAWRENGTDYFQYDGWSQQMLLDYLQYLRMFGYQIVSDIRLSELRLIVLEQAGIADTPRHITISHDCTGCGDGTYQPSTVIAVDSAYGQTHDLSQGAVFPALQETQGIEVIEQRVIDSFSLTLQETAYSNAYAPQSMWEKYFTVSRTLTNDGRVLLRGKAKQYFGFLAIHLRVEDVALIPSPQLLTIYSIVEKRSIPLFAAYMGTEKSTAAVDELSLSQLEPFYGEPFSFWVLIPMSTLYLDEDQRLFLSNTPNESLDPEKQLCLSLSTHAEAVVPDYQNSADEDISCFTDAQPVSFHSSDFERLLRNAMGRPEGEPITTAELASIALINLSDDVITFDGRLHAIKNTAKQITEISLRDLKLFPNLRELYVCDIAVHDVEVLPTLPSLQKLSLIGCSLKSCDAFSELTQLDYLSIARNDIHSLQPLAALTQFTSLNISSNPITTLEPIQTLVHLTSLCCAGNKINDISVVEHMPELKQVWFQNCNITSLEPLRSLSKLESAELSFIPNVTLSLEPLHELENLKYVDLTRTQVDDLTYLSHVGTVVGGEELGPPAQVIDSYGIEENTDGTLAITAYLGSDSQLILPATLDGKPVTRIGESAFESSDTLASVEIPVGITVIEAHAFSRCPLTQVSLPEGLTSIGDYAFWGCSYLSEISLPSTLQEIGRQAFNECGLTSVEIPASVSTLSGKSLGSGTRLVPAPDHPCYEVSGDWLLNRETQELVAYMGNDKEITIPQGVTRIGREVFLGNTTLQRIVIPASVTSIGGSAFTLCSALADVDIQEGLTDIEYYAFSWCPKLEELHLPESLTTIGNFAFFKCTGIKEIVLPDNVTKVGNNTFDGCTSLARVVLSRSLSAVESMVFYGCTTLAEIDIPSSVSSIAPLAFPKDDDDWVAWAFNQAQGVETPERLFIVDSGSYAEKWLRENGYDTVTVRD